MTILAFLGGAVLGALCVAAGLAWYLRRMWG
jgi:hypothetical protein